MSTFPCTVPEFKKAYCEFAKAIGDKSNTQQGIANMHKGLVLHYLGLIDPTKEDLDLCVIMLEMASAGAFRRGWQLESTDLLHEVY